MIRNDIIHMRHDKKLSSATISARIAAISLFLSNERHNNKLAKLKKFKGKHRTVIEDRHYTREEIKRLVDLAPLRDKVVILSLGLTVWFCLYILNMHHRFVLPRRHSVFISGFWQRSSFCC